MHRVLLGLALSAVLAAPAAATSLAAGAFSVSAFRGPAASVERGRGGVRVHRLTRVHPGSDHHGRREGRGGFVYPYPADYYDANYDIDRSWDSDSFNDWWHDQPHRAYPRWVWHNQNCTEDRMWWSGSGWRCTP